MISKRDSTILLEFASSLRERFPAARVWAFGSRTSGRAVPTSDFDICVVIDSLDEEVDRRVMDIAWKVGFDHDVVISTITYSQQEFEEGPCSESPFVQSILEHGIAA